MEEKLKNQCRTSELKIGERYCLGSTLDQNYVFVVVDMCTSFYHMGKLEFHATFTPGNRAIFLSDLNYDIWEFPWTPLEKELT